ncbi:chemotaxis protein CheA [Aliiruegeria haliotis]
MEEIRASFFIECEELLESLQDGLTAIDAGDSDPETVNICFRAVHSMKGGAGAFGLDDLVRFAHRYETVLDEVRNGNLALGHDETLLFMRAADVLSDIVRASRDGEDIDTTAFDPTLKELEAIAGSDDEEDDEAAIAFQPMALSLLPIEALQSPLEVSDDAAPPSGVVISFAPEPELFRSGNEPLHLIRALHAVGKTTCECDSSRIPALSDLDPEGAYLSWSIHVDADASEPEIEEAFDFVDGLCDLEIADASSYPAPMAHIPGLPPLPPLESSTASDSEAPAPVVADVTQVTPESPSPRITLTVSDTGTAPPPARNLTPQKPKETSAEGESTPGPAQKPGKPAKQGQASPSPAKATVRVDLERIDRLVNLVGELVINQAMLTQSVAQAGVPPNSPVSQGLEEFMQLTRDIQDSVMMIRAQPVKSLFQRMGRIVRESSSAVGKRVRMVTDGEATEVDKTVIERLADPLTHMIRNAVDHGLEHSQQRVDTGKSEEGTITLSAAHRSGRVVIEVSDDGAGIDRKKVREIAEGKGLVAAGQSLSDSETDGLLFLPGFSTASKVSNLSGRGVGMDVVRNAIQDLGGRVSIASTPGSGTSFSISLPLTLAVLDGMVVNVAGETLVVPLGAIVETLTLRPEDVRSLGRYTRVLQIRESFVPLLDLGTELGYRPPQKTHNGAVVLLIAKDDGEKAALIVDSILEQRQVVIKGLQDSYGRVPGIAAATILGDGQVALILDPVDLMTHAIRRTRPTADALAPTG